MAAAAAAAITTTPVPVRAGEFEGPLDLLLELVRRNEVSIESMPIAEITRQYLAYLKEAERANVNLGAEFIYMAATLIQIKSRLLLPQDPSLAARRGASEEDLDPQKALLDRLREHAQARAAAEMLKTKLEVEETTWSHHGHRGDELSLGGDAVVLDRQTSAPRQPTLADLIDTLGDALRRVRNHTTLAVEADTVTVEDRMHWLLEQLRNDTSGTGAARRRHNMSEFFGQQPTPAARCCLFLGMLELGRHGEVRIEQAEPFGEVTVAPAC